MSSDPTQPEQPPARRSTEPPHEPAPPTVRMPVQPAGQDPPGGQSSPGQAGPGQAPPPGRMPPGGMRPGRVPPSEQDPAPGQGQGPAPRPAPQWQPTPPATPPPAPQWQPTVKEPALDQTVQQPRQQQPAQWQQPRDTPPQQQPQAGGQWGPPPQQPQAGSGGGASRQQPRLRRRGRNRRTRRWVMATFTIVVLLVLLVIGDRVACAITENAFASQFQSQGVPVKPSVDIEGFPFLTQLAAKDFNKVDISASTIPVNPPTGGTLTITSVHGTVSGLHISGYSSSANAKVDHITATAFISFGSLAAAGSLGGTGVTLTQAGPNTVKITAGVAGLSDTEEAQILQTGPQTITIKIVDSGGGALGGIP